MSEPYIECESFCGGEQKLYRFSNGYGASVVRDWASFGSEKGLWELAVIKYPKPDSDEFILVYDTPITDDVLGSQSVDDIEKLLQRIEKLGQEEQEG